MNNKILKKMVTMAGVALLGASANVWALGEADGQWLKLKYKTQNGLQVNVVSGVTQKVKSTGTCYTQLVYTPNPTPGLPGFYTGDVICQNTTGGFASTTDTLGLNEDIFLFELPGGFSAVDFDDFATYGNFFGHLVQGYANQQMAIKLNSAGGFKKATFQSNGELVEGTLNPADTNLLLIGGYTVTGKSISASKLPFIPAP